MHDPGGGYMLHAAALPEANTPWVDAATEGASLLKAKIWTVALAAVGVTWGVIMAPTAAQAAALPTCNVTDPGTAPNFVNLGHCWYLPTGTIVDNVSTGEAAGYLGANDGHSRYRFIQTGFPVSSQLPNLNGTGQNGAVGIEECDPNISFAAQFGVVEDSVTHVETPFYAEGHWNSNTGDPCINHTPLVPNPNSTICPLNGNGHSVLGTSPAVFCGSFAPVATGDVLSDFAIYYTPGGHHFHQVSFGFCDATAGYGCRQAYAIQPVDLNFWEIGAGVFSGAQFVGAPPTLPIVSLSATDMNCYSCKGGPRPISVIKAVNSSNTGGLEEVVDVNSSGQAVLGPNNTLDGNGDFTMFNGSTSA